VLLAEARKLVDDLSRHSPLGLKGAKHLLNEGLQQPLAQALRFEADYVHRYATESADAMEGLVAFRDKRRASFSGR
jgi:enoyl-CoA hydratase